MAELFEEMTSAEDMIADEEAKEQARKDRKESEITRITASGITVRFADNPSKEKPWLKVYQLFERSLGKNGMVFPVKGRDFKSSEGQWASERYLVQAVDIKDNKAIVLNMPKTIKEILMKRYNKYTTLTDCDWTLTVDGTECDVEREKESERDLSRYEFPDPKKVWTAFWDSTEEIRNDFLGGDAPEKPAKKSLR